MADTVRLRDIAANKTGNAIEGGAKTIDVKAALMANTSVDADDINVDTNEAAKTVTLRGSVTTEAQKTSAEAIAKQNATGYTVKNELVIKPKT